MTEKNKGVSKGFIIAIIIIIAISIPVYLELSKDFSKEIQDSIVKMDQQRELQRKANIKSLLPLAEKGDVSAQGQLAWLYHVSAVQVRTSDVFHKIKKEGTPKEKEMALQENKGFQKNAFYWAKKAAEQEDGRSMGLLAMFYECGIGTEQNEERAIHWYGKNAEAGDTISQYYLSGLLSNRKGIEDKEKAKYWSDKVYEALKNCPGCDLPSGGCGS